MLEYKPIKKGVENENWPSATSTEPLLLIRSANECIISAQNRPIPKMLFGEFWHEEELCILFGDTNTGKSILAVQLADSISKGEAIRGFSLEAAPQPVLYFDFEMSEKAFEKRYSINYQLHYKFDNQLIRIEINTDCTDYNDFEKTLYNAIEEAIIAQNAKVLIIDNLTYLKTQATDTAKEALPLMKSLKD